MSRKRRPDDCARLTPMIREPMFARTTGCRIGRCSSSPRESAHPAHAVAENDVIDVGIFGQHGEIRNVTADDDRRFGLMLADQLAHPTHFEQVRHDRADADYVVSMGFQFLDESLFGREIEQRTRSLQIDLNQHESPRPVERAQRETLLARASPDCGTAPSG